jgi:hypothetical protein
MDRPGEERMTLAILHLRVHQLVFSSAADGRGKFIETDTTHCLQGRKPGVTRRRRTRRMRCDLPSTRLDRLKPLIRCEKSNAEQIAATKTMILRQKSVDSDIFLSPKIGTENKMDVFHIA